MVDCLVIGPSYRAEEGILQLIPGLKHLSLGTSAGEWLAIQPKMALEGLYMHSRFLLLTTNIYIDLDKLRN